MKKTFFIAAISIAFFSALTACSDSESSSAPAQETTPTDTLQVAPQQTVPDTTTTPTTDTPPTSSSSPVEEQPVSSNTEISSTSQNDSGCPEGAIVTPAEFPLNNFIDVGEVYKKIQCNEKAVFIVRHAEREAGVGSESPLTEDGVLEAQAMGAKLVGPEEFSFVHSGFLRTYQTALNISIGRGQAQMLPDSTVLNFADDTIPELADGWYLKDKAARDSAMTADSITNVNVMYSMWAYEGAYPEVFYDLAERSEELIHTYLVKDYAQMPKFTVVASHDQVLMPLAVYATNKQIDLKLHDPNSRNWLNYIAGVAIIINENNELRYVAIKGGEDGVR